MKYCVNFNENGLSSFSYLYRVDTQTIDSIDYICFFVQSSLLNRTKARCDLIHFPALLTDAFCSFTYTIVLLKKSSIGKKNILSSLSSSLFFRVLSLSLVSFSHTIASLTKKKHCQSILMISLNFFIQSTCTRKITHN